MGCHGEDGREEDSGREPEDPYLTIDAEPGAADHPPHLRPGGPVERLADGAGRELHDAGRHGEVRVHEGEQEPSAGTEDAAELSQRRALVGKPVERLGRHDRVEGVAAERKPAGVAAHPRAPRVAGARMVEHPARKVAADDGRSGELAAKAAGEEARAAADVEHAPARARAQRLHHGVLRPAIHGPLHPREVVEERPDVEQPSLRPRPGHALLAARVPGRAVGGSAWRSRG
jgi:hypothetical protein